MSWTSDEDPDSVATHVRLNSPKTLTCALKKASGQFYRRLFPGHHVMTQKSKMKEKQTLRSPVPWHSRTMLSKRVNPASHSLSIPPTICVFSFIRTPVPNDRQMDPNNNNNNSLGAVRTPQEKASELSHTGRCLTPAGVPLKLG